MKSDSIVQVILILSGCCGSIFLLAILQFAIAEFIGRARASADMSLPSRRKGFAGSIGESQKRHRERFKAQRKGRRITVPKYRHTEDVELTRLDATRDMTYSGFEKYVGLLFEKRGFTVEHRGGKNDGGVDLVIYKNGKRGIVQCKQYQEDKRIGPDVVRDLRGAMIRECATAGYLVTTADFTEAAQRESESVSDTPVFLVRV